MKKRIGIAISVIVVVSIVIGFDVLDFFKTDNSSSENVENNDINENNQFSEEKILLESDGHILEFNRKDILQIDKYLEGRDFDSEVNNMMLEFITRIKNNNYYIVHYSCGTKMTDSLLVKEDSNGNLSSSLLSEVSIYQGYKLSPKKQYFSFLFGRNDGFNVIKSNLVVVGTENLKKLELSRNDGILKPYATSILDYQWVSNNTLKATIPDTEIESDDSLRDWYSSDERKVREDILTVENQIEKDPGYNKDYVNEMLKDDVNVSNITWSHDDSMAVYIMRNTTNYEEIKQNFIHIWKVGESKNMYVMNTYSNDISFDWNRNSNYLMIHHIHDYGVTTNIIIPDVVVLKEYGLFSTSIPIWSGDGTKVVNSITATDKKTKWSEIVLHDLDTDEHIVLVKSQDDTITYQVKEWNENGEIVYIEKNKEIGTEEEKTLKIE